MLKGCPLGSVQALQRQNAASRGYHESQQRAQPQRTASVQMVLGYEEEGRGGHCISKRDEYSGGVEVILEDGQEYHRRGWP